MGVTTWTPHQDAELRRLWDEGLSASKIAEALGITKNMVLGRAHRIGVKSRPKVAPGRQPKHKDTAPSRSCSFIVGDAKDAVRRGEDPHCGAPSLPGSAYCADHHARCHAQRREAAE